MIYSEAKTKLEENGFIIDSIQSGSILPVISFVHPKILGEVFVSFTDNEKLIPKEIEELKELNIEDSRLLVIELDNIEFYIDKSISYISDNIIDTSYGLTDNTISLFKDDLKYLDKVLGIITNPIALLDFNKEYTENLEKFFKKVKTLLPTLMVYDDFSFDIFKSSGDENCLYADRSLDCRIGKNGYIEVNFYFSTLTFNNKIIIYTPLETEEIDNDCNVEDFDKIIKKHYKQQKN